MSAEPPKNSIHGYKIHRLVLTGGPCGGKTTAQSKLTSVFEPLGWKVFRTSEVATLLFGGGIKIGETTRQDRFRFEENLMKITLQIEKAYFDLAETCKSNVLVICDRGFMDAVAYLDDPVNDWADLKSINPTWNEVDLRDRRYDQVVHLVTAADGAEEFYTTANNTARSESPELARELDKKTQRAWIGHPYFDVIGNSTDFNEKLNRLVNCVATRMGEHLADRFHEQSTKRKWLVKAMPQISAFVEKYQDFNVEHIILVSQDPDLKVRIRRRAKAGSEDCSYTRSQWKQKRGEKGVELKQEQLARRDYEALSLQRDMDHNLCKTDRRCFLFKNQYFQLDKYNAPENCNGLILLTTYAVPDRKIDLPAFMEIDREVTAESGFTLFNLTKRQ